MDLGMERNWKNVGTFEKKKKKKKNDDDVHALCGCIARRRRPGTK